MAELELGYVKEKEDERRKKKKKILLKTDESFSRISSTIPTPFSILA